MGNEIVKNVVEEEQRRAPGDLTFKKLNDALKPFNSEPSEKQERPSTSRGLNNEGVDFSARCFLCEESDSADSSVENSALTVVEDESSVVLPQVNLIDKIVKKIPVYRRPFSAGFDGLRSLFARKKAPVRPYIA